MSKIQVNTSAAFGPRKFCNWAIQTARRAVWWDLSWPLSNVGAVCIVNISPTFSAVSNAVSVNITGRVIRYPASPPQLRGMPRPLGGGIKHMSIWASRPRGFACPADSDRVTPLHILSQVSTHATVNVFDRTCSCIVSIAMRITASLTYPSLHPRLWTTPTSIPSTTH